MRHQILPFSGLEQVSAIGDRHPCSRFSISTPHEKIGGCDVDSHDTENTSGGGPVLGITGSSKIERWVPPRVLETSRVNIESDCVTLTIW